MKSLICFTGLLACASLGALTLEEGFKAPPASAKPHTWYHMMNGNVTKEGITCDFEALARAGIGGVQMFDAGCAIPPGPLKFNSDAWFDMFAHAHKEAKRLGLEICIPNCSGWSSSGGPWNPPANGMKVTVFTETVAKGPSKFSGTLPRTKKDHGFYEDIAVLAYPTPAPGAALSSLSVKIGLSRGPVVRNTKEFDRSKTVSKAGIIDLTAKMKKDGSLDWDVPAGDWTILRIGYICNGRCNHPASEMGRGLEVDKLSASAMDYHFEQYVARLCRSLGIEPGKIGETGFNNILVDSYEVGCQNWTQGLDKTFEARMGYSLKPYLPVFAGRVVESVNETERFLEDFRRVLADLFAENYAGRLTQLCHKYGLLCSIEPYGSSNADDLQYGQDVDVPMAEFWSRVDANGRNVGNTGNSRFASYLAHVWGRRYAATESFTASPGSGGRWKTTPYSIKAQGDRVYSEGINRIIYHRFVHQPWPGNKYVPGMTMGRWGMHLDRTQTWWPLAGEWFRYQTRCQWMLQEGRFAADVLYWCGEAAPNSGKAHVSLPPGYSWDICATKAVEMLKVRNGKVVTPGGVEYEILVLPSSGASIARTEGVVDAGGSDGTMSERMVRKIGELVDAGARIVAPSRPTRAPGLAAGPDADARLRAAVKEVWAKGVMECSAADALKRLGVKPDFATETPGVSWIHRTGTAGSAAGADWYFVALGNETNATFEASFRQTGRIPEVWDAETGCVRDAPVWREENGRTVVTLDFRPSGSAFVVCRRPAAAPHATRVETVVSARPDPALPEKGHTLVIKKAVYGVFSGSERPECANVTKLIKPRTTVKVNNDAMGGDPSFGKVKQLEVRYVVGGETRRDVVAEGSIYRLPREAKVVGAWYGVIDPAWEPPAGETTVDVTAKLASLVKDGAIDVTVENELAGRDPLFRTPKKMIVTYVYDGTETTATFAEHDTFKLPVAKLAPPPPPTWEWRDGRILAWQPMSADIAMSDGTKKTITALPQAGVPVAGPWNVSFPAGWDAPANTTFDTLIPWNEHPDNGVKYFSGTATYRKRISCEKALALATSGARVMLDLGVVKNFAEVTVNGKKFPVLWRPPFRLDITDAVKTTSVQQQGACCSTLAVSSATTTSVQQQGCIDLEIKVTNLWPNRIIGDDRLYADDCAWNGVPRRGVKEFGVREIPQWVKEGKPSPTGRHTFTTWRHWSKEDDLLPSGLIGPVILRGGTLCK